MMNTPLSPSGQLARYFVAGPLALALALGVSGARAQNGGPVGPAAAPRPATASTAGRANGGATAPAALTVTPAPASAASAATSAAEHPLPAGVTAYIARTYPGSTVGGYFVSERAGARPPHIQYYASITERGGAKRKLYFDAAERPVAGPAPAAGKALSAHPLVYLDGQRYAGTINDIAPNNIANISVFKGEKAVQRFGAAAADGVLVVTSVAHQNDAAVRAFNGEAESMMAAPTAAPTPAAASVPYLAAPALAYITEHYPAARLLGVREVPAPNGGPTRQQAEVAIGRRPAYLLFEGSGQFVSESFSSYVK